MLVGVNEVAPEITLRTLMNGFTLLRLPGSILIDFSLPAWPGVVTGTRGLGPSSPQGARSTENRAVLQFSSPLPRRIVISLRAAAFGPNVGQEFFAVVGSERKAFRLAVNLTDVALEFDNNAQEAVLVIEIPLPASEHELGVGQGDRKYGLRIAEMRIREAGISGGPR